MVANIVAVPGGQDKVFDAADPARRGKIVKAGPEVSEVEVLPDDRLDNPTEEEAIRLGIAAWDRLRGNSTFADWIVVGAAHRFGRTTAMHDARTNKPEGGGYNAAFAAWARKFGFADLDKGDRARLFNVMDNLKEIGAWLDKLPLKERLRLNHPSSIWRRWKAATAENKNSEQKVSPQQMLKDELVRLQEDNDRMKREIERGGGDLWNCNDRPRDIARIVIQQCKSKTKAEKVAREMLKTLNKTPGERAALEEQIEAVRQRAVKEHVSSAEWADVDRMRKRVKRLQEMGR